MDSLLAMAAQKDPGFDPYWFAVALNRAMQFPDELDRWPVEMVAEFNPWELKQAFRDLAMDLMSGLAGEENPENHDE